MKKTHPSLRSQSTLEFVLIIILVLVSILLMGPYVIRSVNAYMRSWEISAEQARHDGGELLAWTEVPGAPPPPTATCNDYDDNSTQCENAPAPLNCMWVDSYEWTPGNPVEDCTHYTYCWDETPENAAKCNDHVPNWCCIAHNNCPYQCPH